MEAAPAPASMSPARLRLGPAFSGVSSVWCSPSTLYTGLSLTPRPRYIVTPSITPHHTASHVTEIPPVICSFSLCFSSHHTWPDLGTRCLYPDTVQRRGWWSLYTAVSRLLLARLPRLLRDLTMLPGCSRGRVSWPRHVSRVTCRLMRGSVLSMTI